jgi:hypothetical protein
MFEVSKVRAFAESLSDEDLARECCEAQTLLDSFDSQRIRRCKQQRLEERIQRAGGFGGAALIVAAIVGIGVVTAGALPAIAGAGVLAAKAARGLTSEALDAACKQAGKTIQSMPDAEYLGTFLILESRLAVLKQERDRRQRKVQGSSFWSDIKRKAQQLIHESGARPHPSTQHSVRREFSSGERCPNCGDVYGPGTTRCWSCDRPR